MKSFKVIIGCDNAAVELKEVVKEFLDKNRVPYEDMGCDSQEDPTVYPEIARRVCEKIMDSGYQPYVMTSFPRKDRFSVIIAQSCVWESV